MNKPITYMILLSFLLIILSLISRQQHILPRFLVLERLILLIIIYIPLSLNKQLIIINPLIIILLRIRVSGARIGMSLIVITRRNEGNDCSTRQISYLC